MYDPVATAIYVVVVPNDYAGTGMCDPIMGLPVAPESTPLFTLATAWVKIPRVNNMAVVLDDITGTPILGSAAPLTGSVTGLAAAVADYEILLYRREAAGTLTGPLPGCSVAAQHRLVADPTVPGRATFNIVGWAGLPTAADYAVNTRSALVAVLAPFANTPIPGTAADETESAVCVVNGVAGPAAQAIALNLPSTILAVRLAGVEVERPLTAPSASSSVTPTPSDSPSPSPSPTPESVGGSSSSGVEESAVTTVLTAAATAVIAIALFA
jgi:hypothetical protein